METPIFVKKGLVGRLVKWSDTVSSLLYDIPEGWYFRDGNMLVVANEVHFAEYTPSSKYSYKIEGEREGAADETLS
jgi:hypothetical protein